MRDCRHVYDIKGNAYVYWDEKTSEGYLCQQIFTESSSYNEPSCDFLGDIVVLKEIFETPPTQKLHEEVAKLEQELEILKAERKARKLECSELRAECEHLDRYIKKTAEEILSDKFKDIPNAKFLIDAVTKKTKLYTYDRYGVEPINWGIVGLNLDNGEVYCLEKYGYDCFRTYDSNKEFRTFMTKEEAEKAFIKNIKNGFKSYSYTEFLKLLPLIERYEEEIPDWADILERKLDFYKRDMAQKIQNEKSYIERAYKNIEKMEKELCNLQQGN